MERGKARCLEPWNTGHGGTLMAESFHFDFAGRCGSPSMPGSGMVRERGEGARLLGPNMKTTLKWRRAHAQTHDRDHGPSKPSRLPSFPSRSHHTSLLIMDT